MKIQLGLYFILIFNFLTAQTVIEMESSNGIFLVSCKANGIPMKFVLDTGASDVSISSTEALFMIKQGLIKDEDFLGTVNYKTASGQTLSGTQIILRTIEIGDLVLTDIKATIVHNLDAPLLLGQSVLEKIGKFTIDGNKLIIQNIKAVSEPQKEILETFEWLNEAFSIHQVRGDTLNIMYSFNELKTTPIAGLVIIGKKDVIKNEVEYGEAFFIFINQIGRIYFKRFEDNPSKTILTIEAIDEGDGIAIARSDSEKLFKTYAYEIELSSVNDHFIERFMKAFKHILDNNTIEKSKQKF